MYRNPHLRRASVRSSRPPRPSFVGHGDGPLFTILSRPTMPKNSANLGRRALITGAALTVAAAARTRAQTTPGPAVTTLADAPLGTSTTITVERRDQIAIVGLNRPSIQNRLDPPMRARLAQVFYQYEHDPSLRALVLFGHGEHFSRGIDVDATQSAIAAGRRPASAADAIDPLGKSQPHLS